MIIDPNILKDIKEVVFLKNEPPRTNVLWAKYITANTYSFYFFFDGAWHPADEITNVTISTFSGTISAFVNDVGYITFQDVSALLNKKVDKDELATVATTGSYNDLSDKPTIPVVPTNVSAFTNDADYITQQDISGKEDVTTIEAPVNATDATLPVTSLTCEVGKYYRLDVPVETLAVTLPAITDSTTVRTVVIYLTAGTTPAVTIHSHDSKGVYYQDGFEIEADITYEINALFNGAAWIVAAVKINTSNS